MGQLPINAVNRPDAATVCFDYFLERGFGTSLWPTIHPELAEHCFRAYMPSRNSNLRFPLVYRGQRVYVVLGYRGHKTYEQTFRSGAGHVGHVAAEILALEPMNGFAVSQHLKQVSGDVLQMSDGSLYPALHKLEQEGWITAEWKTSATSSSWSACGRRNNERNLPQFAAVRHPHHDGGSRHASGLL